MEPEATDTERRRAVPRLQKVWLSIYWIAVGVNGILLLLALADAGSVGLPALVAVTLAATATLIGALFATRILRLGVTNTVFVKSTTTIRVIAVAWILIEFAIVSAAVVAVVADLPNEAVDWSTGFTSTVGAISILAILGPGYSEYREALSSVRRDIP